MATTRLGGGTGALTRLSRRAAPAPEPEEHKEKKERRFKLGIGKALSDISHIPGALVHIGARTAHGDLRPAAVFGKAVVGSMLSTTSTPFAALGKYNPVEALGDAILGDDVVRDSFERAGGSGILGTVIEDVGNVALGAGVVAKVAKAGAARAATGAAKAGAGSQAAALTAKAQKLERVSGLADQVASPYRTVGRKVVSPVTRAAERVSARMGPVGRAAEDVGEQVVNIGRAAEAVQREAGRLEAGATLTRQERAALAATRAAERAAPVAAKAVKAQHAAAVPTDWAFTEPAYEAFFGRHGAKALHATLAKGPMLAEHFDLPEGTRAAQELAGIRRTAEPVRAEPEALKGRGQAEVGPAEAAARARQQAPIPAWIQHGVEAAPVTVQRALANIEGRIQKGESRRVAREQTILADAAARAAMRSPEVMAVYSDARRLLVDASGGEILPDVADQMFGDAVRLRANPLVEGLLAKIGDRIPRSVLVKRGIVGPYEIPAALRTPELEAALDNAVSLTRKFAEKQYAQLKGGRLGEKGLERVGTDAPIMTAKQRATFMKALSTLRRLDAREAKLVEARGRANVRNAVALDRVSRAVQASDAAIAAGEHAAAFSPTKSHAFFRSAAWGPALRQFTHSLAGPGDGATLDVGLGRVVRPAYLPGGDTHGYAVGVREIGERTPLDEWNRVVDPRTGTTVGDQIVAQVARDYQEALLSGDLALGLWVDDVGGVAFDLTQYRIGKNPLTRQQARTLAAVRGQGSIIDFDTGEFVSDFPSPDVAQYFLGAHRSRDARIRRYDIALAKEEAAALAAGRPERHIPEDLDEITDYEDLVAVSRHRAQPDRYKTADAAYAVVNKDRLRLPHESGSLEAKTDALYDATFPPGSEVTRVGAEAALQAKIDRAVASSGRQLGRAASRIERTGKLRAAADKEFANTQSRLATLEATAAVVATGHKKAVDSLNAAIESMNDPSLTRTPAHLQPLWHAYTSLVDEAVQTGDVRLATDLTEMGTNLTELVANARANGFDPTYIPKMSPQQVRRIVFEGMKLGRRELGMEVDAGARASRRYASPELMDRSIAGLFAGYIDSVYETHTNAVVDYVENTLVRPVPAEGPLPKGWVPWDATRSFLQTGESAGAITVGAGTKSMIPESIDKFLRDYGKSYNHWTFNSVRKITDPWRALTLPLRPAWYVNNMVGNMIMATASGVGLKDWAQAWRMYRGGKLSHFRDRGAKAGMRASTFGGDEGALGAITGGIAEEIATGTTTTLIPSTLRETFRASAGPVRGIGNVAARGVERFARGNEVVDDIARVAAYLSAKRGGKRVGGLRDMGAPMSDTEALIHAHKALVDYGNLSPFERSFVRAAVPFYAWQKGVLKLTLRYAADNPAITGIVYALGDLNRELQQDRYGTELPAAYAGLIETPIGPLNTTRMNPFADALNLLTPEGIGQSLNPFLEAALRDVLGAPELGISDDVRIGPTGSAVPVPDTVGSIVDLIGYGSQAQAVRGLAGEGAGEARWLGLPLSTRKEIDRIVLRTKRTRARQAGQTLTEAGLSDRQLGLAPPEKSKRKSLTRLGG